MQIHTKYDIFLILHLSYLGATVFLCAADIHQHQECGDKQSHSAWNHVDWYQEPNEGAHCQEEGRKVRVKEERSGTSLQN